MILKKSNKFPKVFIKYYKLVCLLNLKKLITNTVLMCKALT